MSVSGESSSSPPSRVGGLAAPFGEEITHRGQREVIMPNAFDKMLASDREVLLFTDHSYKVENLLATRSSGSLKLTQTEKGLEYEATLPPLNDKIRHMLSLAGQGMLGASISSGEIRREPWKSTYKDGVKQWTEIWIDEISITPIPAFRSTSTEQRSRDNTDAWTDNFLFIKKQIQLRYST